MTARLPHDMAPTPIFLPLRSASERAGLLLVTTTSNGDR
ncbi:Uncharacterised protein [Bordetella pertussis]|nr:Uncharacterised protein [Bordetella pertussis]CPN49423.1 Uncharacterised protein [Bordetella pertussis]